MAKKSIDINARKALNQMKIEIAQEMGVSNSLKINDHATNDRSMDGRMARRLVESGERRLINIDE